MIAELKKYFFLVAKIILEFLPDSPFTAVIARFADIPFLGHLNYFLPIGEIVAIGQAWLVCVVIFYSYQIVMRLIQMID